MRVKLDSKVYLDLLEIMEHYDDEGGTELAASFYAEFRRYAEAAAERPYSFPSYGEYRRVNLSKFPHHFLFEILDKTAIRIAIIRHDRRHPDFGLNR
jgi:plasmid stabilization system protein ParE